MADEKEKEVEVGENEVDTEIEVETEEEQQEQEEVQEAAPKDEEHDQYSKDVKKRIDQLTFKMREAERREQAALDFAKQVKEENEKLTKNYQESATAFVTESAGRIKSQLAEAKRALQSAYEEGDSKALADAQELVAKLSVENERVARDEIRIKKEQEEKPELEIPKTEAQPQPKADPRAQKWATDNEWFGKDEGMTFTALSIHRRLIEEEGYNPGSEDYYEEIDSRIRKEFPHKFEEEKTGQRKIAQTVAPATRNIKSGRKTVRLTQSQVAIAKKLGVPLEEYAKHVKEA
jgi:hypothetical protein